MLFKFILCCASANVLCLHLNEDLIKLLLIDLLWEMLNDLVLLCDQLAAELRRYLSTGETLPERTQVRLEAYELELRERRGPSVRVALWFS